MEWMLMPLRRYADFSGRSRRKEYWLFTLFLMLVYISMGTVLALYAWVTGMFDLATPGAAGMTTTFGIIIVIFLIFILAILIPTIAVQVRRMHDQDKSGWWVLIAYIPVVNYIGGIVLFVFMCIEGTKGENRFGPDPKNQNIADVFA
jgi:uncharacterized membrane protein YhaH (DUF805 family)